MTDDSAACGPAPERVSPSVTLRLLTYNIDRLAFGRECVPTEQVADVLRLLGQINADIVCLQGLREPMTLPVLAYMAGCLQMSFVWTPRDCSDSALVQAVLWKREHLLMVGSCSRWISHQWWCPSREPEHDANEPMSVALCCRFLQRVSGRPGKSFGVTCVHLPPDPLLKLQCMQHLREMAQVETDTKREPMVVMGDFPAHDDDAARSAPTVRDGP
jgi:endonuclease/exonuclease/phosphatase family metal-dependent hydrolase